MRIDFVKRYAATAVLLVLTSRSARGQPSRRRRSRLGAAEVFQKVQLTAGRSTVVATDFDITRIAVTNPAVADAVVVQPREILVDGKKAGHDQPDRLGRRHPEAVRHRRRAAGRAARAAAARAVPGRGRHGVDERRGDHSVGPRLEHQRHAADGRDRHRVDPEGAAGQPAAGAGRQREPAGDAAGALRRSEPPGADRGGSRLVPDPRPVPRALDDAAVRRSEFRERAPAPIGWCSATS